MITLTIVQCCFELKSHAIVIGHKSLSIGCVSFVFILRDVTRFTPLLARLVQ